MTPEMDTDMDTAPMRSLGRSGKRAAGSIEQALRCLPPPLRALRYCTALDASASPMHRGLVSDCLLVDSGPGHDRVFVKLLHPQMRAWVDLAVAARANAQAASLALAAPLLASASDPPCLVNGWLAPPWRSAGLGDLMQPGTLARLLHLKAQLHEQPLLGARFDVFERIERLAQWMRAQATPQPPDLAQLLHQAQRMRCALAAAGADLRPGHNDGAISNLMLDDRGGMRLTDFDLAGDTDPWFDLACSLLEACQCDADWAAAIELAAGRFCPRLHARARLYGAADDLMWGLWGCHYAQAAQRPEIEFFKYAQWRLLRCRQTLGHAAYERWLALV